MVHRPSRRARGASGAALLLSLATGCQGAASPPAPVVPVKARAAAPKAVCLGYNGLDRLNPAAQVRAGRFAAPGSAPVRVARGTHVDWGLDPYGDRSWQLWFHSLEWLGGLVRQYERTGDRAALDTAASIAQDWLAGNTDPERFDAHRREAVAEAAKFRLATLVCLRRHLPGRWLDEAIADHAGWLARPEHYSGPWNHGTDESMALMTAGCGIGREDLARLGYRRLLDASLAPPGDARPAIDEEGAGNEQSAHYAVYNRARWSLAFRVVRACRRSVPTELARRLRLLDEFIAFQITPGGDLLQIGESYAARASGIDSPGAGPIRYMATRGAEGAPPEERARVYRAGYVMGRSGWGREGRAFTEEMSYTARFGPGRYAHGQNDHMALTFHALGRDVLVPSGHIGYSAPSWRRWLASPEAQNTLVVRGVPFRDSAPTALVAHAFRRGADTFRFSDTAFAGTTRTRSVLAASDPDALVVLDEVRSAVPHPVDQLWHLPPAFTATPLGTGAVATAGNVRVHFMRLPLPGTTRGETKIVRGALDPPQGWIAPAARKRSPAPVVSFTTRTGTPPARILTLIAPVQGQEPPKLQTRTLPDGTLHVEATFPAHTLTFEASPDGTLHRLP
ncbi:heparinase II/III family protein [Spirillospora sp. NPDC049024]